MWAVSDGALYRWRHGRWDVVRAGALGRATVVSVRQDTAGLLWVGTRQGVFRTRDAETFELVEPGIARETSQSADGTLWMTDPVHGARRQGARTPVIGLDGWGMRLLHDSRGNLWVGTTGQGLWRVRDTTTTGAPLIERATMQTGLSSDLIQTLLEDRDGNIWVGTMLGLHSLTPQEVLPLASGALVRVILPEPDNSVWVGTASGLMHFRHDGGAWRGRTVGDRWDIRSLFRDARGQTWARTDHGLRLLAHGQLVEAAPPSAADPPCSDGGMKVGTAPDPAALPRPYCVAHDGTWAAATDGALTVRHGEQTATTIRSPSSAAAGQTVDAIFEDAAGTIWAGGTAGLWRIHEEHVEPLSEREGLPAQRVMAITQSLDGDLWLAVDRGSRYPGRRAALIRLNPVRLRSRRRRRRSRRGLQDLRRDERPGRFSSRRHRRTVERWHAVVRLWRRPQRGRSETRVGRSPRGARAHRRRDRRRSPDDTGRRRRHSFRASSRHSQDPDRLHRAPAHCAKAGSLPLPS